MTSIEIGKKVYQILKINDELVNIVGDKIYPLVAESDTPYPFVVFKRTGITPEYTKDWLTMESVSVEIVCASDKYFQSVDMANIIREEMDGLRGGEILETKVDYITEDFIDDAYIQKIGFNFKVVPTNE